MIWPYVITALIALVVGFALGLWYGAGIGIRIASKDALILAGVIKDEHADAKFAELVKREMDTVKRRYSIKDELAQDADYQRQLKEQQHGQH